MSAVKTPHLVILHFFSQRHGLLEQHEIQVLLWLMYTQTGVFTYFACWELFPRLRGRVQAEVVDISLTSLFILLHLLGITFIIVKYIHRLTFLVEDALSNKHHSDIIDTFGAKQTHDGTSKEGEKQNTSKTTTLLCQINSLWHLIIITRYH